MAETGYSTESLENGIKACKKNIATFEEAIERERATIKDYHEMMETSARKARERKENTIEIEAEREE